MRTALRFLIPLALALAVILPGCYTVVMHPSDEGGYRADQTSDCVRCHGSYHEYPYGYYYDPYPSWWWDYSNYSSYYAYPWWWRYYDYPYLDGDYSYDQGGTSHRGTKFDRRETRTGPMPPPHSWGGEYEQPLQPGINDQVQDVVTGGQSSGTQSRPGADSDESGSRTKDETTGVPDSKDSRQSTIRQPAPPPSDNSGNTTKPAETKDTKKSRTKTRDGGGGR